MDKKIITEKELLVATLIELEDASREDFLSICNTVMGTAYIENDVEWDVAAIVNKLKLSGDKMINPDKANEITENNRINDETADDRTVIDYWNIVLTTTTGETIRLDFENDTICRKVDELIKSMGYDVTW